MKYAAIILLSLICLGCTKQDTGIASNAGYYADFNHNGLHYRYQTTVDHISTKVNAGIPSMISFASFLIGDSVHLTTVIGMTLDTISIDHVRDRLTGDAEWTMDPTIPNDLVYFSPFFHKSDNGGYLERDGNEAISAYSVEQSDVYFESGRECFDYTMRFDFVSANSGVPGCGPDSVSCRNVFQAGELKTKICI